jgi:FtsH-binding integral membrane protein
MVTLNRDHNQFYPAEHGIELQLIMRQVYMWMGLGTLLSAVVALLTVNTSLIQLALNPVALIIALLLELGLVLGLSFGFQRLSVGLATALFLAYAALNGFTLSLMLLAFDIGTVGAAFLATAALFGVMTVFAMTTKMDLSGIGTYLMMGVLIFTALTAYDTQRIGQMAAQLDAQGEAAAKFGIFGALKLYLDFINMFLFLLRLLGGNRRR